MTSSSAGQQGGEYGRLTAEIWSSVEYSTFGPALAAELTRRGIACAVRFEVRQRDYWAAKSPWSRLRLRASAYGIYPLRLALRLASAKPGYVGIISTNTFYAPRVGIAAAPVGVPIIHWVLDLFPDVLVVAEKVQAGSFTERALKRIVGATFQNAAANVFLGEHLLKNAQRRFGPVPRAKVIPVGADASPFRDRPPAITGTRINALYCGNLGRMHDSGTIAEFLEQDATPPGVQFMFRGNGSRFRELETRLARAANGGIARQVSFGGNLDEQEWASAMLEAQVAVVTMRRGAEGLVMPSKTYSALAAGQAILAICPRQSDLAELVQAHRCGWVIEPGDLAGLRAAVAEMSGDASGLLAKRRAAYAAGQGQYDQTAIAGQWAALLQSVTSRSAPCALERRE